TQVGFVELIADVIKRPLTLVHVDTPPGGGPVPFGQNLVYDCHAVYTTTKVRRELGIHPRYTLAAGLAQTFEWYLSLGLDRREIDFSAVDDHLTGPSRPSLSTTPIRSTPSSSACREPGWASARPPRRARPPS